MKVAFVSMPHDGHLNPMIALARKLQSRGHQIVFIAIPDAGPYIRAAGLHFVPYCEEEYPEGSIAKLHFPASKLYGVEATNWTVKEGDKGLFEAASEHLPAKLAEMGVEALVLDPIPIYLELIPISLGVPYVQIWTGLSPDFSGTTPPSFLSWPYDDSPEGRKKNLEATHANGEVFGLIADLAVDYAKRVGLNIDWNDPAATFPKLAVVSQIPEEFDFPGIPRPAQFHYAGPLFDDAGREPVSFPWEKLDGRPLVYASLGTLVNGMANIYRTILPSVARMPDLQVVLAKGENIELSELGPIPPNVIVIEKAPQIELLKRAVLCITHAGLNTALESLAHGVPMVAIPIAFDQPGVAARIAHHQVGEFIEVDNLTVTGLYRLIQKVRNTPAYSENAQRFKNIIAQRYGLDVAAEVIENTFKKGH